MKLRNFNFIILTISLTVSSVSAENRRASASQITHAIISACIFEEGINEMENITIYVMGNDSIAETLKLYLNRSLGKATLREIKSGKTPPAEKPTIILVGHPELADNAIAYCQENNVLSITHIPEVLKKGISLGVGLDKSGEPELIINREATIREGKSWKKPMIKMARIIE